MHTSTTPSSADDSPPPLIPPPKYRVYNITWANGFKESDMALITGKNSLFASALAAIGASVCCVGPLILLTLGIGGAWVANLTALEPYRPIFIGLTLLFLGLAFYTLYLAPHASGSSCAVSRPLKRQRLIFWLVAVLLLGLLAVPWLAPLFY